jgi:hypothetical protein
LRIIALIIVLLVVVTLSGAAAWKEYPQPQLGFVVEFPSEPANSMGTYKTGLVTSATAHIYAVKEDHALYVASVVDLLDRKEEGATLLGEAESYATDSATLRRCPHLESSPGAQRSTAGSSPSIAVALKYRTGSDKLQQRFERGSRA